MLVSDFDYNLPEELIAQHPTERREMSRMLALDRVSGQYELKQFTDFQSYLRPGDCLVLNDTKVIPARLWGHRAGSGGRVQAFMLEENKDKTWKALLRPGRRLSPGSRVELDGDDCGGFVVVSKNELDGTYNLAFDEKDVLSVMEKHGKIPLPPYINRNPEDADFERYQTVYAQHPGAVAAPTAGLHFTPEILKQIEQSGVKFVKLTLHVGAG
ncbi:MAG: S-adenosylmethionine:tRNA ribosyltransferase-isomerase, partial [Victivallales bacterium]|nr:S-adenosylmethionine:tRNA ribosyltransferase-isomerase [Victivallales bacterium]